MGRRGSRGWGRAWRGSGAWRGAGPGVEGEWRTGPGVGVGRGAGGGLALGRGGGAGSRAVAPAVPLRVGQLLPVWDIAPVCSGSDVPKWQRIPEAQSIWVQPSLSLPASCTQIRSPASAASSAPALRAPPPADPGQGRDRAWGWGRCGSGAWGWGRRGSKAWGWGRLGTRAWRGNGISCCGSGGSGPDWAANSRDPVHLGSAQPVAARKLHSKA